MNINTVSLCAESANLLARQYVRMFPGETAMDFLTRALQQRGYDGISPESLQDLSDEARKWGWSSLVPGFPGHQLRMAYNVTFAGFRALLEPKGGW